MNGLKRKHKAFFDTAGICSVVSSLSLLAAMLVNGEGKNKGILVVFGLLFWGGLIAEQIFFWKADRLMKMAATKQGYRIQGKPGILSFAAGTEGLAADGVFLISLIALVICVALGVGENLMQYIFICVVVLAFRLHCFLNGRNYKYRKLRARKVDHENG